MKRIILSTLVLVTITASAFSRNIVDDKKNVLNSFYKNFSTAKEVKIESQRQLVKISFDLEGQKMFAYYQQNGEQVAVSRNIKVNQLPINLLRSVKEKLNNRWLTDLFEVVVEGETSYYATIIDSDRIVVYKADAAGSWAVYKKTKRDTE